MKRLTTTPSKPTLKIVNGCSTEVELRSWDADIEDYFNAFKTCLVGAGFSESSYESFIKDYADELNEADNIVQQHYDMEAGNNQDNPFGIDMFPNGAIRVKYDEKYGNYFKEFSIIVKEGYMGKNNTYDWHYIYGGESFYEEITHEEFEERFYNPWVLSLKSATDLDISNA